MAIFPEKTPKSLHILTEASAGNRTNYLLNFWGQLIMGVLYSLGHLPFHFVGVILGFIMPGIWVFCTYRLIKASYSEQSPLPFPVWMQKDPGNMLVIIFDLIFLAIIWALIIAGYFNKTWVKLIFTVAFPLLTLSMLRNLMFLLKKDNEHNQ